MKRLTIIIAFFSCLNSFGQNFDSLSFGSDSTLDIISWNVENFPKNGNTTTQYFSDIIDALDADIFAFQEIGDTDKFIEIINNKPEYDYYIGDWYYTALVFAYKTSCIDNVNLYEIYTSSTYWSAFPRSPLVLEFSYKDQDYAILNNHLKCCGDGYLDMNNSNDEEHRRYTACQHLNTFIEDVMDDKPVLVVGDMNDELDDSPQNNVFSIFINDPDNYLFADMDIAIGNSSDWSFPTYPSHLDHILISNELFETYEHPYSNTSTIKLDEYFNSFYSYIENVSDHRPVGINLYTTNNLSSQAKEQSTFTCFPNPCTNTLTIESTEIISNIKILTSEGQLISNKQCKDKIIKLDISTIKQGHYLLQITSKNKSRIHNIIKIQ